MRIYIRRKICFWKRTPLWACTFLYTGICFEPVPLCGETIPPETVKFFWRWIKYLHGTGNMKLMMNGAITLGTLDGANVEIHDAVGDENIVIFGMTTPEVNELKSKGYVPMNFYNNNAELRNVIDFINRGFCDKQFPEISGTIVYHDPYMVLADFADYRQAQNKIDELWADRTRWNSMSLMNTACSGRFAADRAVNEYAKNIWHTVPAK